jgi:hypothetical protein
VEAEGTGTNPRDRAPRNLSGTPAGSAGHARGKGTRTDGLRDLQSVRRPDMGHPDDAAVAASRARRMAGGTRARTGNVDRAPEGLEQWID